MNRIGFLLKIKENMIEEYKNKHDDIWPEMLEALSASGWHNYSIFMKKDGTLFGYFETQDSFEVALEKMGKTDVNERWQTMMSPFFELPEGAHADEQMIRLEEVFHLE